MLSWSQRRHKRLNLFEILFSLVSLFFSVVILLYVMIKFDAAKYWQHHPGTGEKGNQINYFYQNRSVFLGNFFSFFTIQTNLLCIFLMLFAGIMPHLKGKIKVLQPKFILAVVSYISITGLAFDTFLLQYYAQQPDKTSVLFWCVVVWEHNFLPIGFICWASRCIPVNDVISIRYWKHKWLIRATLYPVIYTIVIVLRGIMIRSQAYHLKVNGKPVFYHGDLASNNTFFCYFMLNVYDANYGVPGWGWLLVVFSFNLLVLILVSYAGVRWNNYLVAKLGRASKAKSTGQSEKLVHLSKKIS